MTYRLPIDDWRRIAMIAGIDVANRTHRKRVGELIAIYRLKAISFSAQNLPKYARRNLATLQKESAKLLLTIQKPYLLTLLRLEAERHLQTKASGNLHAKAQQHVEKLLANLKELRDLARKTKVPPAQGKFQEFKYPRSDNPPLMELVFGLSDYWKRCFRGRASNSVDHTREPPVASPMTKFVRECIRIAGARDSNGNDYSLEATRKLIGRAQDKR
ncbi:MAG: hypothetical protein ABL907_01720 [Hyphomicrobium sp.]